MLEMGLVLEWYTHNEWGGRIARLYFQFTHEFCVLSYDRLGSSEQYSFEITLFKN